MIDENKLLQKIDMEIQDLYNKDDGIGSYITEKYIRGLKFTRDYILKFIEQNESEEN